MISERISDDIPPQMKILNMVIPILTHYYHFSSKKTAKRYHGAVRPAAASCIKPFDSHVYSLVNHLKAT